MGVSHEDHEKLQALVDGELGIGSIAKLRSKLTSEIRTAVKLDLLEEVSEEYTFPVDPCDRRIMQLCQKTRTYEFWCTRSRWFGFIKDDYAFTVTEWLDEVMERSSIIKFYPSCGCHGEEKNPLGFVLARIAQKILIIAPWFATDSGAKDVGVVNMRFPVADGNSWDGNIAANNVPGYLLFMANVEDRGELPASVSLLPQGREDATEGAFKTQVAEIVLEGVGAVARFVNQRPGVSLAIAAGLEAAIALYTRRATPTHPDEDEYLQRYWAEEVQPQETRENGVAPAEVRTEHRVHAEPDYDIRAEHRVRAEPD
jgi:hypothetical protein